LFVEKTRWVNVHLGERAATSGPGELHQPFVRMCPSAALDNTRTGRYLLHYITRSGSQFSRRQLTVEASVPINRKVVGGHEHSQEVATVEYSHGNLPAN
jgi:hypothetical protein